LARGFTIGHPAASATITHVAVLFGWSLAGTLLSYRFVRRRLYA
jgi:hypothetical protein